ncbi:MAG: NADPH-dependent F420 reductase [Frankiaceae bacterium]
MRIAVLGTGVVGQTLSAGLAKLGHEVTMGTRDVEATRARDGDGSVAGWLGGHPEVALATFADAAAGADLVVNASSGAASLAVLEQAGDANLDGKPLLDVSNPLDFSAGFPPTLLVKDTDSLAEQIQRAHPGARVVKSLNTVNAALMIAPADVSGGDHTIFVAGDDADAKQVVEGLLHELGWRDVQDVGDLTGARGLEMLLPLWLRLLQTYGSPAFNFKVVR